MPTALEAGGEECVHDIERQPCADHTRAYRQHVGVIVLADQTRRERVGADAATDALELVRGHHDALAGATQDDTQPTIARGDEPRRRYAALGVVGALGCGWPDVDRHPAARRDMGRNGL